MWLFLDVKHEIRAGLELAATKRLDLLDDFTLYVIVNEIALFFNGNKNCVSAVEGYNIGDKRIPGD